MRCFLIVLVLAGALVGSQPSGAAQAGDPPSPTDLLVHANELDDMAVGYAATRTPVYEAFNQLYQAGHSSLITAKHLVSAGSPAGRIYGYLILRHLAPSEADAVAQKMLGDQAAVVVRNGCVGRSSTVAQLVARIQKGDGIIALPGR
jgi:hypothetical protein